MANDGKAALLVIDMEEGFLNAQSPLYIQQAAKTVPACARVIAQARQWKIPVFFVNRIYRRNGSDVEAVRYAKWLEGGRCLAPNSTGACSIAVPAEFTPQKMDYTIIKPRFSAFFQTELDLILRRLQVDTILLTGTTTPNCIRATCYDGLSLDYNVVILEDCCSSRSEQVQRANLEDMAFLGADVITSEDFLREGLQTENVVQTVRALVAADQTAPE